MRGKHGLESHYPVGSPGRAHDADSVCRRSAAGVLAGRLPAALEISRRGGRVAAVGAAPNGAWLLPPAGVGPAKSPGSILRKPHRAPAAVLLPGIAGCVGAL